jgi:tetratricopeptide (TPR) repeat protein
MTNTFRRGEDMDFYFPLPEFGEGELITTEEVERRLLKNLEDRKGDPRQTLWNLAIFYGQTNRVAQAVECVERLWKDADDPEEKARRLLALGGLMEKANDFVAAEGFYRAAYALEPCDPHTCYFIRNNLGFCLNKFGNYAEAEQYLTQALSINPDRHNAHKNLGISCEGRGEYIEATEHYIAAIRRNAADPRALGHLEQLVNRQPTLLVDIPYLANRLTECRQAVAFVRKVWSEGRPQGPKP